MELNDDANNSSKDEAMKRSLDSLSDGKEATDEKPKKKLPIEAARILAGKEIKPEPVEESPLSAVLEILHKDESKEDTGEEAAETEPPLETLSDDEIVDATGAYVEASLTDVGEELAATTPDTKEELEAATSLAFYEALGDKLQDEPEIDDNLLDEAVTEALDALDVTEAPADAVEESVAPEDTTETDVPDSEEIEPDTELPPEEVVDEPEDEPEAPITPPPTVPPASGTHPLASPPLPVGLPPSPLLTPSIGLPSNLNAVPLSPEQVARRRGGDILLGGVVGYLIGRRRGRIKTEERLLPVQEKLEKEVKSLHEQISRHEQKARAAAAKQFEIINVATIPLSEKRQEKLETLRKKTPEVSKPEVAPLVPEQQTEIKEISTEILNERQLSPQAAEKLTLPLLLEIASDIKLGERSLRSLYENGVIDQQQLRTVLKQYLQGESLESIWPEALAQDMVGVERQQEHAPERSVAEPVFGASQVQSTTELITSPTSDPLLQNQVTTEPAQNFGAQYNSNPELQNDSHKMTSYTPWIIVGVLSALTVIIFLVVFG